MKRRFVQIDGELREVKDGEFVSSPMIQPDIAPYKSMVTGEVIEGRKAHREHLKKHNVFEIGNEVGYAKRPVAANDSRKELIRAQVDAMPERKFRQALMKDIDFVKWNSRR